MAGVVATGTMVLSAVPAVLWVPARLVTMQVRWTVPEASAVKVGAAVVSPAVKLPPVMVQA